MVPWILGMLFLGMGLAQPLTLPDLWERAYGEGGFRVERVLERNPRFIPPHPGLRQGGGPGKDLR